MGLAKLRVVGAFRVRAHRNGPVPTVTIDPGTEWAILLIEGDADLDPRTASELNLDPVTAFDEATAEEPAGLSCIRSQLRQLPARVHNSSAGKASSAELVG